MTRPRGQPSRVAWQELRDLAWDWDPIGVREQREDIDDEYDCVLNQLISLLARGAGRDDIVAFLERELTDQFGIDPAPPREAQFAAEAMSWWERRRDNLGNSP